MTLSKYFTRDYKNACHRITPMITPQISPTVTAAKIAARYDINLNRTNHDPIVPMTALRNFCP